MTWALNALLVFGLLISTVSLLGVLFPMWLVGGVKQAWQKKGAMFLAVIVRIALGSTLIAAAPQTGFPAVVRIIGVLGLIAAVVLPIVGWQRIDDLMAWFQGRPPVLIRVWCTFGVLAGAFVVVAVR
jgi:hypothetical protein